MKTLNLVQGSPEWGDHRFKSSNASEAPAMMGGTPHMSRDDLIKYKATGIEPEVDSYMRDVIWPNGHKIEAWARGVMEERLGIDLFTVTGVRDEGNESASYDGMNLGETIAIEVKQWNKELAAKYQATGKLDPLHYWQLEHQHYVCPTLEKIIFIMTDGTEDNWVEIEYTPARGRRKKLLDGWEQFWHDVSVYKLPEGEAAGSTTEAAPVLEGLPAVQVQVSESKVLSSNLDSFRQRATDYIESINTALATDQDFVNAEADVKFCKKAESDLVAAKDAILAQSADVSKVLQAIDDIHEQLRQKRLSLDKLVKTEKERRKSEIIQAAIAEVEEYCDMVDAKLDNRFSMPADTALIAGNTRGLKTLESIQSKANDAVAALKVEIKGEYQKVRANLDMIPEVSMHLFPDFNAIGNKDPDDFQRLVNDRLEQEREKQERIEAANKAAEKASNQEAAPREEALISVDQAKPGEDKAAYGDVTDKFLGHNFESWWEKTGSKMTIAAGETREDCNKRIAKAAWNAASAPF